MSKYVGNTMMVGLTFLLGCSQAPHRSTGGPEFHPGSQVVQSHWPAPVGPCESPPRPGTPPQMLPRELPPAPPRQQSLSLPPSLPTLPEAIGVRVFARQGPGAPATNVIPPEMPPLLGNALPAAAASARSMPEVVLLGVGGEAGRTMTLASGSAAPAVGGKPEPASLAPELSQGGVVPPPVADTTANPGFAHADDYGWLTGELEHIRAKNVWRLRYAPADQEDRYGGAVQLVGDGLPPDCKNGQVVRVEGQVMNPEAGPRPPYWVRSFKLLKAAPPTEE